MTCFHPLKGWRSRSGSVTFSRQDGYSDRPVEVPCGQCIGCRIQKSQEWAIRCMHEAQMHEFNCFLTLTYNDANKPKDGSVHPSVMTKFMKDLRNKYGSGIRFFGCGEYGDEDWRPHYHIILFNHEFGDKYLWEVRRENPLYRSSSLEQLWPYGYSTIGSVTMQSAAYVARYTLKKVTGDVADDHYAWRNSDGDVFHRNPEFVSMSRGGRTGQNGIGETWLRKYAYTDAFVHDFVILDGKKYPVPRFYQKRLQEWEEERFRKNRAARKRRAIARAGDNSPARLKVREKVLKARLDHKSREL